MHSDYRPDNLLFSVDEAEPAVAVVDWQGFQRGCAMSDVSFIVGNALEPDVRRAHEDRLVRGYHAALVEAGVSSYSFDECWDDYASSLLSALLTTIFGAMYGVRTERGDRMFELMGARHALPDPRPARRPLPRTGAVSPTPRPPRACVVPVSYGHLDRHMFGNGGQTSAWRGSVSGRSSELRSPGRAATT